MVTGVLHLTSPSNVLRGDRHFPLTTPSTAAVDMRCADCEFVISTIKPKTSNSSQWSPLHLKGSNWTNLACLRSLLQPPFSSFASKSEIGDLRGRETISKEGQQSDYRLTSTNQLPARVGWWLLKTRRSGKIIVVSLSSTIVHHNRVFITITNMLSLSLPPYCHYPHNLYVITIHTSFFVGTTPCDQLYSMFLCDGSWAFSFLFSSFFLRFKPRSLLTWSLLISHYPPCLQAFTLKASLVCCIWEARPANVHIFFAH